MGQILARARRFDEALAQLNRVIALDPNFWVAYWYLGQAYHGKGQYAEAVATYRKGLALNDNPVLKALLIRALARTGERGEAVKLLGELQAESARRYVPGSAFAIAYGALGDKDKAFAELEKAYQEHDWFLPRLKVDSIFDSLRDDARYKDLLKRMNLPE